MKAPKKGTTNQKNYVFHEIKEIKGKKKPIPQNIEIIEDLTEIHEIKEIRNNNNYNNMQQPNHFYNQNLRNPRNIQRDFNIVYEGEPSSNGRMFYNNNNPPICGQCQEEIHNHENYDNNYKPNQGVQESNNDQMEINYGHVNAPFLFDDNQENNNFDFNDNGEGNNIDEEDYVYKLIETIFEQLNNGNILNNINLKNTFKGLNENDKREIIEGIKIKIENKTQENRFNDFLNSL